MVLVVEFSRGGEGGGMMSVPKVHYILTVAMSEILSIEGLHCSPEQVV